MTKRDTKNKNTIFWTIAGIGISWLTFWLFLLFPFGLIAWLVILMVLINRNKHLKYYILLSAWLFVPSCNFLTGSISYFTGTATLKGIGGPFSYIGIDPTTRVPITSFGACFVYGFEPFVFPPNNSAVRLWTNLFGYQKGAYEGIFPTQEEAEKLIQKGDTLNVEKMENYYQFNFNEQIVQVDTMTFYPFMYYIPPLKTIMGTSVNNECFLFQSIEATPFRQEKIIYLVDIEAKRLLTQYYLP